MTTAEPARLVPTFLALAALTALLALGAGCTCSGPDDPCPVELRPGDPCEYLGLECLPPTAKCTDSLASTCVCSDKFAGGLSWDCSDVKYCRCACPCGDDAGTTRLAVNTCEALGCVNDPTAACPAIAAEVCKYVCLPDDAGPPDARPDAGTDGPHPDGPPPDAPPPDAPQPDAPQPDAPPPDSAGAAG